MARLLRDRRRSHRASPALPASFPSLDVIPYQVTYIFACVHVAWIVRVRVKRWHSHDSVVSESMRHIAVLECALIVGWGKVRILWTRLYGLMETILEDFLWTNMDHCLNALTSKCAIWFIINARVSPEIPRARATEGDAA